MRVASYCRVSTDNLDQLNSFESQCRYFSDYIKNKEGWELFRVYADEGISGTATENRTAFKQLIKDARNHCFELVLTKEVSRFSRNILDTIYYTRELKRNGVYVLFMNDGINTAEPDSELRLSIMASIAQEESRKTSSRVKWGQQRRMEQGIVFGRSMLGYDVRNGQMHIEPHGAELVKRIYEKYALDKKTSVQISKELSKDGFALSPSHIIKVLKNEKYKGDLIQKKTYTPDYLSHKKKYNHGQEELIEIRNHHDPIISEELWTAAQNEMKTRSRRNGASGNSKKHRLSGRLTCGLCDSVLTAKKRKLKEIEMVYWACPSKSCTLGRRIRDDVAATAIERALSFYKKPNCTTMIGDEIEYFKLYPEEIKLKLKECPQELTVRI